jgi:cysteine-rich repeat protein
MARTLAILALVAWASSLPTVAQGATVQFAATIDGAQETPPTFTGAMGSGTFTMDTNADSLTISIIIAVPPPSGEIAAHIHGFAPPGVPAGILFGLPLGSPKNSVWNFAPAQEASIIAGLTYVNIHSNAFPGGEIRGQILRVPSCGDGILDGGETCDDGNNVNGDCCDATCQAEPDGQSCGVGGSCNSGACVLGNHYLCHQVKDLKVPAKFVPILGTSIIDQTGNFTCEVKKPKYLCNPADKNGSGIADPNLHYCCYQVKCATGVVAAYDIEDQFGELRLETKKPKFVCNPCDKALAP